MKKIISPYVVGDITLRMLEEKDLPLTLSWRNDPKTRIWFKNSDEIKPESHKTWFDLYNKKQDDYVFIAESSDGPIGQLAVYQIANGSAEIGRFIASPEMKGKGVMKTCIEIFIEFIFDVFKLDEVVLEVYENNERAVKLYMQIGFETVHISNDLIHMRLVNVKRSKNMAS
ncbi:GNAT family N-acetyltransferase [Vibrio fluvialis]|uniref:GNAT family N-acetyltransferase n=1 Tax=Vibrio fluvialis TaxID=676 RepID=UPI00117D7740|nr:GNAT family N-acetyltransferase [Vibrio fluvialis]EKO3435210.1 GNAT family N-acetyltransferase [Vibrio fluvialis]MBY7800083.1 GNAT family N-acetyltransferase [Vibrio fluvialis]MBY8091477.1 GNAT family N-acetyltransferase [Vibrio fluvialis]MBY8100549.1 GNAT family N-acetyltransferase [Vibrio fluvialis]MBY8215411.1 GNAT family N-acetyltransferase [Vibrio fluvialis]